jgi:hypothetical protein
MGRNVEDANTYRIGHPLAQQVLQRCLSLETPTSEITFQLTKSGKKVSILNQHLGKMGWLVCAKVSVESFEAEDHILLAAIGDNGDVLDEASCKRLFDLPAEVGGTVLPVPSSALEEQLQSLQGTILDEINQRNSRWLDQEIGKLDRWSEDKKFALEQEIKDLDHQIRESKRASTAAMTLADKLGHQRTLKVFQATRNEKRKDLFAAQDEVEARRDGLISEIEARMTKEQQSEVIFTIRWSLE